MFRNSRQNTDLEHIVLNMLSETLVHYQYLLADLWRNDLLAFVKDSLHF